jgi:hypothetical protein
VIRLSGIHCTVFVNIDYVNTGHIFKDAGIGMKGYKNGSKEICYTVKLFKTEMN